MKDMTASSMRATFSLVSLSLRSARRGLSTANGGPHLHSSSIRHPGVAINAAKKDTPESKRQALDRMGAWDTRIDFPLGEDASMKRGTVVPIIQPSAVGVCTKKGRRSYQEDR